MVGALAWPAVSSGAAPAMSLRRSSYGFGCARERREEGGARATERMERPGSSGRRPDQVKPVGRGAPIAGVRPPRCRRWLGRGGRLRAGERGRGRQAEPLSGPKGRQGWPSNACPFSIFFLISFLKFFSKFIWTNLKIIFTSFSLTQSCSKTKTLQLCFNKQDQIPNRI